MNKHNFVVISLILASKFFNDGVGWRSANGGRINFEELLIGLSNLYSGGSELVGNSIEVITIYGSSRVLGSNERSHMVAFLIPVAGVREEFEDGDRLGGLGTLVGVDGQPKKILFKIEKNIIDSID